jgi:hypothetical protein
VTVRQALAVAAQSQNLRVLLGNFSTDSDKLDISISDKSGLAELSKLPAACKPNTPKWGIGYCSTWQ